MITEHSSIQHRKEKVGKDDTPNISLRKSNHSLPCNHPYKKRCWCQGAGGKHDDNENDAKRNTYSFFFFSLIGKLQFSVFMHNRTLWSLDQGIAIKKKLSLIGNLTYFDKLELSIGNILGLPSSLSIPSESRMNNTNCLESQIIINKQIIGIYNVLNSLLVEENGPSNGYLIKWTKCQ